MIINNYMPNVVNSKCVDRYDLDPWKEKLRYYACLWSP